MAKENEKEKPEVKEQPKPSPAPDAAKPAEAPKPVTPQRVFKAPEPKLRVPSETKLKFLVWFTEALDRFDGVKAHHLHAIQSFFRDIGLGDPETPKAYDEGLLKFGFGRKK